MSEQIITSERHQKAFLGGIERLLAHLDKEEPGFLTSDKVTKVLHQVYDKDLAEEEVITKWGTKGSKKYTEPATNKKIRTAAKPFIQWLEEAEEDESDDE